MVFDGFRRSFEDLLTRATRPEERRAVAARMKETLVQARLGLDDLRAGLEKTRQRLALEERELETVRRRKQLAEGIGDRETVDLAAKYEEMHNERVAVARQKLSAQEAELALAERDVGEMSTQLKAVLLGTDAHGAPGALDSAMDTAADTGADTADPQGPGSLHDEIDSLGRARARADREADAAKRLDELKRRMRK
jgi:hypothetical protein